MDPVISVFNPLTAIPNWFVGSLFGAVFFAYYVCEVVKKPLLACSEKGRFRKFLETKVPLMNERFWPTMWCFESRAQTLLASLVRCRVMPEISYEREVLQLKDGGEVGLDWLDPFGDCSVSTPVVIILPGLTGASHADYVKGLALMAQKIGLRTLVFNNRGIGGIALKTPRTYCAANIEDLTEVIEYVHEKYPNAPLAATGISMGGLILGNYLAAHEENACNYLSAAMLISVPWNVFKGTESIEKPVLNLMLNHHLASCLCKVIESVREVMDQGPWVMEDVLRSQTIREFDSHFTAKQFGYKDVEEYYHHATLHNKLHKIHVPVLCLSAADDPFQPLDAIPISSANDSENVAIVVTARGGHIGFMEGIWPFSRNQYMFKLFAQFFESVFNQGGYKELKQKID